eukprot:CAMPEP_0170556682 /NCGR_PEP_ID=MMETSP0211-20121228/18115_1 /TAXON_ID=311385 /ORGANISM="Pseudokeronopsis sp., Strain OXSARD2" /LENGTH=135 /DNA_ID=CAMNT_0010867161 /DNA_START=319 /DNA_END=726 /DNA_ORIENTATION=+
MSVYFRLLFGSLDYRSFDKVEEKFKYNDFSPNEYEEYMETHKVIETKMVNKAVLSGSQFLIVRPSSNNMHTFVAQQNSCFFDICLPNYTTASLRRITYYEELEDEEAAKKGIYKMKFDASPPYFPQGFEVTEVPY